MSLINICGLQKSYNHSIVNKVAGNREYPVLRGIDLHVEKGDFIGIMGHSGCGKTTLLKIMGTIDKELSQNYLHYFLSFSPIAPFKNQLHSSLCA